MQTHGLIIIACNSPHIREGTFITSAMSIVIQQASTPFSTISKELSVCGHRTLEAYPNIE